jgi:predicted nucleic acid-binding protein
MERLDSGSGKGSQKVRKGKRHLPPSTKRLRRSDGCVTSFPIVFIIDLDGEIKRQTIQLRKSHKIKIPEAIIAASSIVKRLPLYTGDKGFSKISALDIVLF